MSALFAPLQKVGQSLMVPVSVLPAAGLLVALGRLLQGLEASLGKQNFIVVLGQLLYSGGLSIFEQLPVVFAIGVAIGFTGGAGISGLAATVGYFTLKNVLTIMTQTRGLSLAIDTGVFGGILVGLVTATLYERFHQTRLHPVLGFFSGKRLVPIVTAGTCLLLGVLLGYVWPPIQIGIQDFGNWVVQSSFGPAFYAAGKRLLIPVGLHHVYYPSFLYQFGDFVTQAGQIVKGDSARYFAGDVTAGRFMASEFPLMLFGLPAATLAMYFRAPQTQRAAIGGVMLSAALTSMITGITEPIEFSFIFVAPILFVFHVFAAFLSGWLTGFFDIHLGYTFSASIIDFGVGYFNQHNSFYLWVLVGPLIAVLYFVIFYFAIGWLDLATPGREKGGLEGDGNKNNVNQEIQLGKSDGNAVEITGETAEENRDTFSKKAWGVLQSLGGVENIRSLDACITRLRVQVKDSDRVLVADLKRWGAVGVLNAGGGSFQAIFGTESDRLKDRIHELMQGKQGRAGGSFKAIHSETPPASLDSKGLGDAAAVSGLGRVLIPTPLSGRIIPLEEVPDEVFSQKMLGDGFAICPEESQVVAPLDAEVIQTFRTGHALGLKTKEGVEILIHVGLDTVKLAGQGFQCKVSQGQKVRAGDLLLEFDLDFIRKSAKSDITPMVITNADQFKKVNVNIERKLIEVQLS